MICLRALQRMAGRAGRDIADKYAREGETRDVQALRSLETVTLREIERRHADGPCRCEECEEVSYGQRSA